VLTRQIRKKPSIILWGDSHLLAWSPALDQILTKQGKSAIFAEMSACPPIFDFISRRAGCLEHNKNVRDFLVSHPEITTIVISANWSKYLEPISAAPNNATQGLTESLEWLHNAGKSVLVIGPVPVYEKNVPLSLALAIAINTNHPNSNINEQINLNTHFYESTRALTTYKKIKVVDPIQWMCTPDCLHFFNGHSLYRDSNHLSVQGALNFVPLLEVELSKVGKL
jgi:hypothetical protein